MKKINNKAFSLVEIIVVCGVVALFVGTAVTLLSNFRQGYSRSENSSILLQDGAMFLAQLRNDLNNAVLDPSMPSEKADKQLEISSEKLSFKIYDNREGKIVPVSYTISGKTDHSSLSRQIGNGSEKTLIKNNVASLSWRTEIESFSGKASGTVRLCIEINASLQTEKGKEKPFEIRTKIFPARLNRQLNGK